ncbi:MAG TPA: prepilin-type N-terminal cleavage/methylation domain-containing protein [Candidatus Omnitrophota bacterium]|nr:prepilin-type N-terminal cleavage/methylation domain-containing protein [Candidatus Omnitrophota bacterium]
MRGFTLIEVLIVVVIIAVLAGLTLPRMFAQTKKAKLAEAMQICGVIARSEARYASLYGEFTPDLSKLDIKVNYSNAFPGGSYYGWYVQGTAAWVGFGLGFNPASSPANDWNHKIGIDMIMENGAPAIKYYWWREDLPGRIGGGTLHTSPTGWEDVE